MREQFDEEESNRGKALCQKVFYYNCSRSIIQGDTKKRELLKNPTKIEEIQEKKLLTETEPLQLAF